MITTLAVHAALSILVIWLVYDQYHRSYKTKAYNTVPTFNLHSPYTEKQIISFKVIENRLIDIDFKFEIIPKICNDDPFLLIIVVSSKMNHFKHRNIIRNTWGQTSDAVKVVFSLGVTNDLLLTGEVYNENNKHRDIVQGNFFDSYHNMSYKHMMAFKWVVSHCPSARYLLKADDDIFLNYHQLMRFLSRDLSPWGAQGLISCAFISFLEVDRKEASRWYISKDLYDQDMWPDYCQGSMILYTTDLLPALLEASQTAKYIHVDDAFITGVLPAKLDIDRTDFTYLFLTNKYVADKKYYQWGYPHRFLYAIVTNPEEIQMMWDFRPCGRNIY